MKKKIIAVFLVLLFVFLQIDFSMIKVNAASIKYANDDVETFEKIEGLNDRLISIVDSTNSKDELLRLHVRLSDESYSITKALKNTNVKGIVKDSVTNIYFIQFDTKEDVENALNILDGKEWVDFAEKNEELEVLDESNLDESDYIDTISNIRLILKVKMKISQIEKFH